MDWVNRWWSTPKEDEPDGIHTMEKLQESIDSLQSRKMQLMQKIYKIQKEAQTLYDNGQMNQAKAAIARKRTLDSQVKILDGQLIKLEQTANAVESTAMSIDMAAAMKDSSLVMNGMLKKTSVVEIENIHDDLSEHMEDANSLADTLSRPFGGTGVLEEDDEDNDWQSELKLPSVPREKHEQQLRLPVQSDSSGGVGSREKLAPL